jgi:hypothetical protein
MASYQTKITDLPDDMLYHIFTINKDMQGCMDMFEVSHRFASITDIRKISRKKYIKRCIRYAIYCDSIRLLNRYMLRFANIEEIVDDEKISGLGNTLNSYVSMYCIKYNNMKILKYARKMRYSRTENFKYFEYGHRRHGRKFNKKIANYFFHKLWADQNDGEFSTTNNYGYWILCKYDDENYRYTIFDNAYAHSIMYNCMDQFKYISKRYYMCKKSYNEFKNSITSHMVYICGCVEMVKLDMKWSRKYQNIDNQANDIDNLQLCLEHNTKNKTIEYMVNKFISKYGVETLRTATSTDMISRCYNGLLCRGHIDTMKFLDSCGLHNKGLTFSPYMSLNKLNYLLKCQILEDTSLYSIMSHSGVETVRHILNTISAEKYNDFKLNLLTSYINDRCKIETFKYLICLGFSINISSGSAENNYSDRGNIYKFTKVDILVYIVKYMGADKDIVKERLLSLNRCDMLKYIINIVVLYHIFFI